METKYENKCRVYFHELLDIVERTPGYSHSQVLSVMVTMDVSANDARKMLDTYPQFQNIDWSEVSWTEMRDEFTAIRDSEKVAH